MIEKLKWCYRFLRSKTYVLLLDKQSVVCIPLADIDSFESQFMLSAQSAALHEFSNSLEELISEHEQAIQLLSHRESYKAKAKKRPNNRASVSKATPNKRTR